MLLCTGMNKTTIRAEFIKAGDRIKLTKNSKPLNVKEVRESGDCLFVDIGLETVMDLLVLHRSETVYKMRVKE
jgi:hypothetical protein